MTDFAEIIRDLDSYGSMVNKKAADLLMVLEGTMTGVDWSVRMEAASIVKRHLGRPMTDADLETLFGMVEG